MFKKQFGPYKNTNIKIVLTLYKYMKEQCWPYKNMDAENKVLTL